MYSANSEELIEQLREETAKSDVDDETKELVNTALGLFDRIPDEDQEERNIALASLQNLLRNMQSARGTGEDRKETVSAPTISQAAEQRAAEALLNFSIEVAAAESRVDAVDVLLSTFGGSTAPAVEVAEHVLTESPPPSELPSEIEKILEEVRKKVADRTGGDKEKEQADAAAKALAESLKSFEELVHLVHLLTGLTKMVDGEELTPEEEKGFMDAVKKFALKLAEMPEFQLFRRDLEDHGLPPAGKPPKVQADQGPEPAAEALEEAPEASQEAPRTKDRRRKSTASKKSDTKKRRRSRSRSGGSRSRSRRSSKSSKGRRNNDSSRSSPKRRR